MSPPSMQKHVCEKRPEYNDSQIIKVCHSCKPDIIRNESEPVYEGFSLFVIQNEHLEYKDKNINEDQYPVYDRDTA
jgi:hypothetical protein